MAPLSSVGFCAAAPQRPSIPVKNTFIHLETFSTALLSARSRSSTCPPRSSGKAVWQAACYSKRSGKSNYTQKESWRSNRSEERSAGDLPNFQRIDVGIEHDQKFRVVQRLIGPRGKHMRDIVTMSEGAKLWITGRGSRSWEDDEGPLRPLRTESTLFLGRFTSPHVTARKFFSIRNTQLDYRDHDVSHIVKPRHEDDHTPQASFVSSDAFGGALEIVDMAFVFFQRLRIDFAGAEPRKCSSFLCRSRLAVEHF